MNSETFVGNLTRDPELRHSQDGNPRATFSIAINEGDKDKGTEKTHYINVVAFGSLGENVVKTLKKGTRVVASCRLDTYSKAATIEGDEKNLTMVSFIATAIGPDLRWAVADVTKASGDSNGGQRSSGNGGSSNGNGNGGGEKAAANKPAPSNDDF